jgi:membrane protease YdiL (CAAX protease family)
MNQWSRTDNQHPLPAESGSPPCTGIGEWIIVWLLFAFLIGAFWAVAGSHHVLQKLGGHVGSTVASFALLLAPLWGFGFGLAEVLHRRLHRRWLRRVLPATLVLPYCIFAAPRGLFSWAMAAAFLLIPLTMNGLLDRAAGMDASVAVTLRWQDGIALLLLGLPVEFHWLARAFPIGGLGALPKLLLFDAALYGFLVTRQIPGVGFDLRVRARDLKIGVREWSFFAPIAIGLGLLTGFAQFHARMPAAGNALAAVLVTFFLVALPEEFYFRGLLQNLLETRMPQRSALWMTAILFGFSHFNKGMTFNARYVLLAAIAGLFYGRAWLDRRRVTTSAVTHTMVDVIWSLWFR